MHITLRMRLLCEVCRAGEADPQQTYEVMNEVVVDRGANPYLTKIECWEHGRLITKVRFHMLHPRAWFLTMPGEAFILYAKSSQVDEHRMRGCIALRVSVSG